MIEQLIGIAGGLLGIVLFMPQIIKSFRTKHTKDISAWTYILILINQALWVSYGLFKADPIIYVPNIIGILLSGIMLSFKRRYG